MSTLLSFDTSTESASLALSSPTHTWTREVAGGAQASAALIPELLALLAEAGLSLNALDAIAFGRGPGAFTGLRTACSVAQGLAFGAGKPVLPLDSLLLVAEDARRQLGEPESVSLWVAMDARMGEVYAAPYRWQAARWSALDVPRLYAPEALSERWTAGEVIAGSALSALADRLVLPPQARPMAATTDRAAALAAIARQAWADGAAVDAALALPLYVRDKVAQTTAEREALRAGSAAGAPV
jgi:tRNA threonylcarbamoyladenosine biosynthesis protein TsaB